MHLHTVKELKKKYLIAFGHHLKHLLVKHNRDAMTVASIGKLEPKQVYRVLNGEHAPSLGTIYALAKGLNLHPKELFNFEFFIDSEN